MVLESERRMENEQFLNSGKSSCMKGAIHRNHGHLENKAASWRQWTEEEPADHWSPSHSLSTSILQHQASTGQPQTEVL